MTNVEKLKKFITDNNLEFNSGSGGDVNILALCGYGCYINTSAADCINSVESEDINLNLEISRVFEYAATHNYHKWWKTDNAKKLWKYEELPAV
jgi:hypothetical protein